jgi:hypothetical protein
VVGYVFRSALVLAVALHVQETQFGRFIGAVRTEWLEDGRRMRLLEDFRYVQPDGAEWLASMGDTIDGASIPRVFWSFIGGPFEGRYRNASVVHDVACDEQRRPWRAVHRMFYLASRAGGVGPLNARVMYGAVYHFGPRWTIRAPRRSSVVPSILRSPQGQLPLETDADFLRMREFIRRNPEIALDSIERLTRGGLERAIPEIPQQFRGLLPEPGNGRR